MTWICAYCGTENFQGDRIGRREPRCRKCTEERIAPEDLERRKETDMAQLDRNLSQIRDMIAGVKESIEFHESIIEEHTGPLTDLREELGNLRDEMAPIVEAMDRWENLTIFYEPLDRGLKAERDKYQQTLPFELGAVA